MAQNRGASRDKSIALLTLVFFSIGAIFLVIPVLHLLPRKWLDSPAPEGFAGFAMLLAIIALFLLLIVALMYIGGVVWMVVMRHFLPSGVLRELAFSGPRIALLSPVWEWLGRRILGSDKEKDS